MRLIIASKTISVLGSFISDQTSNLNATLQICLMFILSYLASGENFDFFTPKYSTIEKLQHYSQSTTSSIIQCTMKCQTNTEEICIPFRYIDSSEECYLYNICMYQHLSHIWRDHSVKVYAINNVPDTFVDCQEAHEYGIRESGVYSLAPDGYTEFDAWCDFDDSHGWTVFQRRLHGGVDFYRYWADYKQGFGDVNGEYWLGNDKIHALTQTNRKLSIYLMRQDGDEGTSNYSMFYINNESDDYRLAISGFSGDVDDSMTDGMGHNLNGYQFSTRDRGNTGCATDRTGAWWYWGCTWANLNGVYTSSGGSWGNIKWYGNWAGFSSMLKTAMRVTRDRCG